MNESANTKFCPLCNKEYAKYDNYCMSCGEKLELRGLDVNLIPEIIIEPSGDVMVISPNSTYQENDKAGIPVMEEAVITGGTPIDIDYDIEEVYVNEECISGEYSREYSNPVAASYPPIIPQESSYTTTASVNTVSNTNTAKEEKGTKFTAMIVLSACILAVLCGIFMMLVSISFKMSVLIDEDGVGYEKDISTILSPSKDDEDLPPVGDKYTLDDWLDKLRGGGSEIETPSKPEIDLPHNKEMNLRNNLFGNQLS